MANVRAMLEEKRRKNPGKKLMMVDVNRPLVTALLSLSVYGKEARDEEILSVIINAGNNEVARYLRELRNRYSELLKDKKVKKTKDGVFDDEGFMVLVPKL